MFTRTKLAAAISTAVFYLASPSISFAAEDEDEKKREIITEEIVTTGTRITKPGTESSSLIFSIDAEQMSYEQESEVEKIIRNLPATVPGDGGNVNNGTAGAATIDLRGLGPERNLVLMDGHRLTPFNFDGEVDTAVVPTSLLQRIDVVTGGASAVYGSDAIAGAVNFIMKKDFTGVEIGASRSETGDGDGRINNVSLTMGSDLADDRGNIAMFFSWMEREPVLFGQRQLGTLGIDTESGANFEEFLNNQPPAPPPPNCGGPFVAAEGGSTTAIPTRFAIIGGGAAAAGQFREDRTLADECSVFNFNPFNFYQTGQERYSVAALGHFDVTDEVQVYSRMNFTNTTVSQQVAPSGTFGQGFNLPLFNPFIGDQARQFMIDAGNTSLESGLLLNGLLDGVSESNWQDVNENGVVDSADFLAVQLRRRTVELGARIEDFDSDQWQILLGVKGEINEDWSFDASYSYGESNRTTVRDGYTNLTNIQNALLTADGVTCLGGDATCVPIDLFGGFGTITPEMAGYARAVALQQQKYDQFILNLSATGVINAIQMPMADYPLAVSFGFETREENGSLAPDECLKLAPASCQGGAGGNLLPISGGYEVDEFFFEGILPIFSGASYADSMSLEFGYRDSDHNLSGSDSTWKIGVNWRPVETLMVRVMQQEAIRAPNVGELFSPVVTGLENAKEDPCSVANENIDDRLRALCISTGMSDAQVGQVQDIVSGQINTFDGSDPNSLPGPETADTLTAGFVWTPDFDMFSNFLLSVDYYDIEVEDIIGEFTAQEILDGCYVGGLASECDKIFRVGGDLTLSSSGLERFTTNLDFKEAKGIEVGFAIGLELADEWGDLQFTGNINKFLTSETQSAGFTRLIDCRGRFGTSCDAVSDLLWTQRTTWTMDAWTVSLQWRHVDSVTIEEVERGTVFSAFQEMDDYDYFDLYGSYTWNDVYKISLSIDNLTTEDPPVVGNEAGDTAFNSGNTFPSNYETLGRVFTLGFNLKFGVD